MSSYMVSSDEVAEDYKRALEDLTMNSRYEISNLTIIAKENTEHALAISEVIKNHIRQTSPQKKLPALYVLDSVVKNVGTPYTLFLSRQLYQTFMEAYALVDGSVRKKMDEMLKTWKEPVPGSIDARPVFPPDITRPIENALIKARTNAVQLAQARNQQMGRGRSIPPPTPYRETATPPNFPQQGVNMQPGYASGYEYQQYPPPMNQQYNSHMNGVQQYGHPQQPPPQQYPPQPSPASWQQKPPPQYSSYCAQEPSIDTLSSDIANLITETRQDFAQTPWDSSIQTRLKAMLDLQNILQSQTLPPDQIGLIKSQVAQLSKAAQPSKIQTPPVHVPSPRPVAAAPPPVQQPSLLSSVLGPGALAALLARQSSTPQVGTPTQSFAPIRSPASQQDEPPYIPPPPTSSSVSAPASASDASALLQRLRAAGMLPGTPAATSTPTLPFSPVAGSLAPGISSMSNLINTPPILSRNALAEVPNDVVFKPTSLKIPRPHLISSLYEKLGIPCTQCGRRFPSDEQGKKKRSAHMDWHFRTHKRMTEAEKKGQHRSWYVDELDWIKSREVQDDHGEAAAANGYASGGAGTTADSKPQVQYVLVPDDPALTNSVCPICQEKFEMKWLDEAQEFVWMDARKIGEKIYHASCFAEATKDGGGSQLVKTDSKGLEPILGKRKAEDDHLTVRSKIKTES